MAQNNVEVIENLPPALRALDLSRNNVTVLGNQLPQLLEELYLTGNKISSFEAGVIEGL